MALSEIDPQMAEILAAVAAEKLPSWEAFTPPAARAEAEARNRFWNESNPAVAEVRETMLPGPRRPLRLRIYVPEGADEVGPALLFVHGGGWVICSLDTHDGVCRRLANASGLRVLSLDYGLAPEEAFPAPVEDVVAAMGWLAAEGPAQGVDPARIAIGGDSAGANLSLAACLALRDRDLPLPAAAVLIYGVYSADNDSPSHRTFGGGDYLLSSANMSWFWDHYVADPARRTDPLAAPLHADLAGLPPLYVSAASLDPLLDDSLRLRDKLVAIGAEHEWHLWQGVTHACIMMSRLLPAADRQIEEIAEFLRRRLGS